MKTRRKTRQHSKEAGSQSSPPTPPPNLQTLVQALLCNPKGFNQLPLLKSLYTLLVQLQSPYVVSSNDIAELSHLVDALFCKLQARFKQLFSALCNVNSVSAATQQSCLLASISATSKEFTLMLRCCLVIITFPQLDQNLVLDKCVFLLSVFARLCSLHVIGLGVNEGKDEIRIRSRKVTFLDGGHSSVDENFVASLSYLKPSHSCIPLLCDLFEVLADELLVHKSLRENFMLFDCLSSSDFLVEDHPKHGDMRNVMELFACHFILSYSGEQVCDSILDGLSWNRTIDRRASQLGLNQCILLLLDSSFLSAPEIFQSHLIMMVSDAIGIDSASMSLPADIRLMNCYLLAFERSVALYTRHIYALHIDGNCSDVSRYDYQAHKKCLLPSFDVFIRPTTRHHFDWLLSKLDDNWQYFAEDASRRTKAELVSTAFAYIEESNGLFTDTCKDKMLSFTQSIVMVASGEVNDHASCKKVQASLQHMFLIASILKSMNASLLQAIRCLKKCGDMRILSMKNDFRDSKEYDFIVRVTSCFQKLNEHLPLPSELLQENKAKHRETKQMLLHFCCFLSLGFRYKLEFLVKGCIFTIMTLLSLIIFEDGHLDYVNPLLVYLSGDSANSFRGELYENQSQVQNIRKSSHSIASKFQKIQTLFSSQSSPISPDDVGAENSNKKASAMHVEEETCSGKMYLNCIFDNSKNSADIDDLSDFIECKRGKDYSAWLKDRDKYRKRKVHKMAVLRWEKRKRTWHSIKGVKS